MTKNLAAFIAGTTAFLLVGCVIHPTQPVWRNDTLSLADANNVRNECYTDSTKKYPDDTGSANSDFERCLKKNGFRKNPQWGDAPMNPLLDIVGL